MEILSPVKASLQRLQSALRQRNAVKIIAGIANFDETNVLSVARAAESAGAHVLDIAESPALMAAVRQVSNIALMVSAVDVTSLLDAAAAGADALELGNFDALYEQGIFLNAEDVLTRAEELMNALPQADRPMISVTVPGHLSIDSQIRLAKALEILGVDLLQTEGATRVLAAEPIAQTPNAKQKALIALHNTHALSAAVRIPVIAASGMTADNVALAFEAGAAAVGIGAYVNRAASEAEMIERARAVMANRVRTLSQVG
jgi:hypothetical protein